MTGKPRDEWMVTEARRLMALPGYDRNARAQHQVKWLFEIAYPGDSASGSAPTGPGQAPASPLAKQ